MPSVTTGPNVPGSSVAISPDGMRLVYVSGTPRKLFTRRLDQPKVTELPGTQDAVAPFFSPDGQWIGFKVGREKVSKISVEGGAVVPLAGDVDINGASRLWVAGARYRPVTTAVAIVVKVGSGNVAEGRPKTAPGAGDGLIPGGPAGCMRTRGSHRHCDTCGREAEPAHIPVKRRGVFCAVHCPCCSAITTPVPPAA